MSNNIFDSKQVFNLDDFNANVKAGRKFFIEKIKAEKKLPESYKNYQDAPKGGEMHEVSRKHLIELGQKKITESTNVHSVYNIMEYTLPRTTVYQLGLNKAFELFLIEHDGKLNSTKEIDRLRKETPSIFKAIHEYLDNIQDDLCDSMLSKAHTGDEYFKVMTQSRPLSKVFRTARKKYSKVRCDEIAKENNISVLESWITQDLKFKKQKDKYPVTAFRAEQKISWLEAGGRIDKNDDYTHLEQLAN